MNKCFSAWTFEISIDLMRFSRYIHSPEKASNLIWFLSTHYVFFFSLTLRGFCLRIRHKEPSLSAQKIRSAHVFIYKWNGKKIVPFLKIINCFSAKSFFFNCGHFHVPTSMWSKQMKKKIGFCVEKFVCLVLCGWKLCRLYYVVTELFGKQMMRCSYS